MTHSQLSVPLWVRLWGWYHGERLTRDGYWVKKGPCSRCGFVPGNCEGHDLGCPTPHIKVPQR